MSQWQSLPSYNIMARLEVGSLGIGSGLAIPEQMVFLKKNQCDNPGTAVTFYKACDKCSIYFYNNKNIQLSYVIKLDYRTIR